MQFSAGFRDATAAAGSRRCAAEDTAKGWLKNGSDLHRNHFCRMHRAKRPPSASSLALHRDGPPESAVGPPKGEMDFFRTLLDSAAARDSTPDVCYLHIFITTASLPQDCCRLGDSVYRLSWTTSTDTSTVTKLLPPRSESYVKKSTENHFSSSMIRACDANDCISCAGQAT